MRAGDALPTLAGVPLAVKDVISTHGIPTTCGSRILEGYKPPYDATAVTRLEQAGAIILGKTNCDEFAMGSSNENSAYGPVRNPVATDRVPAAPAAARRGRCRGPGRRGAGYRYRWLDSAAGFVLRRPGAQSQLWPSFSAYGLIAYASSLDRIGPFANTVRDAASVMSVIAGRDPSRCDFRRRACARLRRRA